LAPAGKRERERPTARIARANRTGFIEGEGTAGGL